MTLSNSFKAFIENVRRYDAIADFYSQLQQEEGAELVAKLTNFPASITNAERSAIDRIANRIRGGVK